MTLNVHRFLPRTKAEGPGVRAAIWVQGCSRHCKGCFAAETWIHEPNMLISPQELTEKILSDSETEGITVLGGEPFEQAEPLSELIEKVSDAGRSVIVFTGNNFDELSRSDDRYIQRIIELSDVIVDGEYIAEQRDFSRKMVGSRNQRFFFLTDRYTYDDFPPNTIEARVMPDGKVAFNGMGDFDRLREKMGLL